MTKLLTYITVIFLIIGIPSALAELVQPSRGQWIHWVLIASAVLAALWILRLIIWIKGKREESKIYGAMNTSTPENAPPRGPDWIVNEHGQASRPEGEPRSEPLETREIIYPSESVNTSSHFKNSADFFTNEKINRLVKEKRITIEEAKSIRQQTSNMDLIERERFLSAIERREETQRQERDNTPDSILKKYGFGQFKFRKR